MKSYFYICETNNGWRNLAFDEYILNHIKKDEIFLYLYINADSVIIGKNQNAWKECNISAMDRDSVKLVRRISGGGAVFHDVNNLNFSFIAGEDIYDVERQLNVILKAVRELGIPASFSGRNDILADGRKFSGNAFCGRGVGRQHHGTLLINSDLSRLANYLNVSEKKIRSKGISSVRSRVCNLTEFVPSLTVETMAEKLIDAFKAEYGEFETFVPNEEALSEIAELEKKHSSWEWRLGQAPAFDIELYERFSFGEMQIFLDLKDAVVSNAKVYTDALDISVSDKIEAALIGKKFMGKELSDAVLGISSDLEELSQYILKEIP